MERLLTTIPSLSSSPLIRSVPQSRFSRDMVAINSWTSGLRCGRPPRERDFQRQVESTDVWGLAAALDRNGHRWFSSGELKQPEKENQTMADNLSMALAELLRKADAEPDLDTLREGVRVMTQALMELEVAQHLGAERYQRSPDRQGERNGYRDRNWDTRVGTLELRVPRVRDGSFFPGMLEPRKRAERALVVTVREAYVQGVSTRRVH